MSLVPIPSPGAPVFHGEPGNPVVVVLPDMYGRLPWLDSYAGALASKGFRVAIPDFYDGFCTIDSASAQKLMGDLDIGTALALIDDAIVSAQEAGVERVGLVGFSLGGWLALLHAQAGAADAVVAHYTSLRADDHGVIPCPVLLQWAEFDDWDEGEDPEALVARLKDHGTPVTQHRYLGTEHGFANATVPGKVDHQAAALAFARTVVFLEANLVD